MQSQAELEQQEVPGRRALRSVLDQAALDQEEERLLALLEEFERRQRRHPELAVRPWWSPAPGADARHRVGFVVEYCPDGRDSAEIRVRAGRVTVEGDSRIEEAELDLSAGWRVERTDAGSPEILANRLIRIAEQVLGLRG